MCCQRFPAGIAHAVVIRIRMLVEVLQLGTVCRLLPEHLGVQRIKRRVCVLGILRKLIRHAGCEIVGYAVFSSRETDNTLYIVAVRAAVCRLCGIVRVSNFANGLRSAADAARICLCASVLNYNRAFVVTAVNAADPICNAEDAADIRLRLAGCGDSSPIQAVVQLIFCVGLRGCRVCVRAVEIPDDTADDSLTGHITVVCASGDGHTAELPVEPMMPPVPVLSANVPVIAPWFLQPLMVTPADGYTKPTIPPALAKALTLQ